MFSTLTHTHQNLSRLSWLALPLLAAAALLALLGLALQAQAAPAAPALITVNTVADDFTDNGNCSLREAIQAANTNAARDACPAGLGADTILIPAGIYTLTRTGAGEDANATGDLDITDPAGLTLMGVMSNTTILDGNGSDRVLHALTGTTTVIELTIRNGNTYDYNDTIGCGGGIHLDGEANITNVTFTNNMAGTCFGFGGGGGYFQAATSVSHSVFISNAAQLDVTGVPNAGGGGASFKDIANIYNSNFIGNIGSWGGGASFFGLFATISNTTFINNIAYSDGGGASFYSYALIVNSTFISNTILASSYEGGGGASFERSAEIIGTTFSGNSALYSWGGGAFFGSGSSGNLLANVTNSIFVNNTSGYLGGGAFFSNYANIQSSIFMSNSSLDKGGGAWFDTSANLHDTIFISNTAYYGDGGGAWFGGATNVDNTAFIKNATVDTTFQGSGGGAFFSGYNGGPIVVSNTLFISNLASGSGGGAFFGTQAYVTYTTFAKNTTNDSGGGAYFWGPTSIDDTLVISNTASQNGGGIYLGGWLGTATGARFVNTLFNNNHANRGGSAIHAAHDSNDILTLLHTTITSPTLGSGVAVYVLSGTAYLTNTLIDNYSVGIERVGGNVMEDYDLFSNVPAPYSGTVLNGGHSLTGTASFVNPGAGDYHLNDDSAAIDAGTNAGVNVDLDGVARPWGPGYDIGAYEAPVAFYRQFLPFVTNAFRFLHTRFLPIVGR